MNVMSQCYTLLSRKGYDPQGVIALVEVGSRPLGLGSKDVSDSDYSAVRIEPWEEMVVGNPSNQSFMLRTQPEGKRSGPNDLDLNVYTLRKFIALAAKGNPSILVVLFSPLDSQDPLFQPSDIAPLVASKLAGRAFLGYLDQQLDRIESNRSQRPELVEKFGYDTKFAGHAVRLGFQGVEYMQDGIISVPMPPVEKDVIRAIRAGVLTKEESIEEIKSVRFALEKAMANSDLPASPDYSDVNGYVTSLYGKYFGFYQ